MDKIYRSPYEAYPFLCDGTEDLRCDFELLTDELSSHTGLLLAGLRGREKDKGKKRVKEIQEELLWTAEMIYHLNPSLRTRCTITPEEVNRLKGMVDRLRQEVGRRCEKFVLPIGSCLACEAHLLRVKAKSLVRLLYRHAEQGQAVEELVFDFSHLLSGYFFHLALWLNELEGLDELSFVSRNYG